MLLIHRKVSGSSTLYAVGSLVRTPFDFIVTQSYTGSFDSAQDDIIIELFRVNRPIQINPKHAREQRQTWSQRQE